MSNEPKSEQEAAPEGENHRETGARKFPARPGHILVQDGIFRGGTETGDPSDRPPSRGMGLTEKVEESIDKTRKSDAQDQ
ncbi:hypothetical protein GA830_12650 [Mesorhizobium sp. NBSH29]|uniref:hypothetical protein n=1 Tax=Mesorhizobium sp. NBSH29 TaxID=2654249 RepID=UPI0018968F78|nr:hypothetical protein [Mesorhizobium sp. NBSH29]QPC87500.1 hypothetical protein GA830_12650 [Mesorhizobium sp. NBSH29]